MQHAVLHGGATARSEIDLTEYVNRLAQNVARHSDLTISLTIKVINAREINAFALPGRFMFADIKERLRITLKANKLSKEAAGKPTLRKEEAAKDSRSRSDAGSQEAEKPPVLRRQE